VATPRSFSSYYRSYDLTLQANPELYVQKKFPACFGAIRLSNLSEVGLRRIPGSLLDPRAPLDDASSCSFDIISERQQGFSELVATRSSNALDNYLV
jgi:hypothetical protein